MEDTTNVKRIPQEEIERFINGEDPMERIVNLDYKSQNDYITIYYRDEQDRKCTIRDQFYPFVWATRKACLRLCEGDRAKLKSLMAQRGIGVKVLSNISIEGTVRHEFDDGYMFMFFAKRPMSYTDFTNFFKICKNPIYSKKDENGEVVNPELENQYLIVPPQEQYLIASGKRFFKGYDDYDKVLRMTFDLETTGLDTEKDRIVQLGVRFNRPFPNRPNGFEKIFTVEGDTEEEKNKNELKVIDTFFRIIYTFRPDILTGHNIENFDLNLLIGACKRLGTSIEEITSKYFDGEPVRKNEKESILKLGGEIEVFHETIVPYTIVTDSLHAVRRAQAIDSNMQRADLKYATEYSGMKKENRVYTPGGEISKIWADKTQQYAFNNTDGDWYIYDSNSTNTVREKDAFNSDKEYEDYIKSIKAKQNDKPFRMVTRNKLMDGYEITTGRYIIERYLLDDLYEGDKVEWKFNSTNFLICKMLPVPYKKCTTMGTAGQWKALMLAWSYKNNLAIPPLVNTQSFTGGLSRLLKTGFAKRICKLDFNSLYPSIILTWGISDTTDLMSSMLSFLEYVLTTREKYKKEKKKAEKIIDKLKGKIKNKTANPDEIEEYKKASADFALADGKQLQMKVLGNSFFGSYGALIGSMFPWKSAKCAEQTTCTGRQSLRLMISWFTNLGYTPVVGDSVTGDTPLFIRYKKTGLIDIMPISEIMDKSHISVDEYEREYDYSEKPYQVLCRNGWSDVKYVYRHKTDKPIYRVIDTDKYMSVDVTEDHSLFNENREKIKPNEINENTRFEYYQGKIETPVFHNVSDTLLKMTAYMITNNKVKKIHWSILNSKVETKRKFLEILRSCNPDYSKFTKTIVAGLIFIIRCINENN